MWADSFQRESHIKAKEKQNADSDMSQKMSLEGTQQQNLESPTVTLTLHASKN